MKTNFDIDLYSSSMNEINEIIDAENNTDRLKEMLEYAESELDIINDRLDEIHKITMFSKEPVDEGYFIEANKLDKNVSKIRAIIENIQVRIYELNFGGIDGKN